MKICNMKITGIPTENLIFLVLCRNVYIPASAPTLPPARASRRSIRSGTLHCSFFARFLSIPKTRNVTALTIRRYPAWTSVIAWFPFPAQRSRSAFPSPSSLWAALTLSHNNQAVRDTYLPALFRQGDSVGLIVQHNKSVFFFKIYVNNSLHQNPFFGLLLIQFWRRNSQNKWLLFI